MAEVALTVLARDDLKTIYRYSFTVFGEAQAERYTRDLYARFGLLAEFPGIGTLARIGAIECLKFASGSHVIYYRRSHRGIVVGRILHGAHAPPLRRLLMHTQVRIKRRPEFHADGVGFLQDLVTRSGQQQLTSGLQADAEILDRARRHDLVAASCKQQHRHQMLRLNRQRRALQVSAFGFRGVERVSEPIWIIGRQGFNQRCGLHLIFRDFLALSDAAA